ncbi:hypothetical protein BC830DRAFT_1165495 [Chytriomyces sp. MP71]|nr:hypothetical protein BC830DRAFT_1165495 [Chytriomyces sp. MP71]
MPLFWHLVTRCAFRDSRTFASSSASTPRLRLPSFSVFANAARPENASKAAVVDADGVYSYARLLRDAFMLAQTDEMRTIKKGDRVAFLFPRQYPWVVAQWCAWMKECVAVPLSTSQPASELAHVLSDAQASIVIHHPSFGDVIKDAVADERVVKRGGCRTLELNIPAHQNASDSLVSQPQTVDFTEINKEQGAMIIYTSGTTGKPKGVLTTFKNVEAHVSSLLSAWHWSSKDKILLVLPLHHVHGVINVVTCALAAGATLEMAPEKLTPAQTWERFLSPEQNLTLFMAVPTIYARLLENYDSSSLSKQKEMSAACSQFRLMVSGSAALPSPVFDRWERISGHRLLERYGMTEIGMALGNRYDGPREPGRVGVPFPNVEVKIVDEVGRDVTSVEGASGELLVRGPQVFKEYWNNEAATRKTFQDDWFVTGDIVTVTKPHGSFQILGRASQDIIKSGGFKLSALVIEREILSLEGVKDVAVVGVPDEVWGERVAAVIVVDCDRNRAVVENELVTALKTRLAKYEVPTRWYFCDQIPRNAMGKVSKKGLVVLFK